MSKAIITAALTGSIHTPSMSPYLPFRPNDLVAEAVRAWEAGAAAVHLHVRDPETGQPSSKIDLYAEVAAKIKSKCDVVITITTGGGMGMTAEQRVAPVPALKPELSTFNFGSMNFAFFPMLERYREFKYDWEKPFIESSEDYVPWNTFRVLKIFARVLGENNTKPEIEIYDVGMLSNLAYFIEQKLIAKPVYIQFVLGIMGGLPATTENVLFLYNTAKALFGNFAFSVCAAGRHQIPMCVQSFLLGGNARVGLEDNLYLEKGVLAKSNAEQVSKLIRIARELGIEPATPAEARKILNLKGLDKVNF
jgi:3,5-dioxohexanoate:acetyl-CoA acetone transferase